MAKATKVPEEYTVSLEMTRAEAEVLVQVLTHIGGVGPAREKCDGLFRALRSVEVEEARHTISKACSAIYFERG